MGDLTQAARRFKFARKGKLLSVTDSFKSGQSLDKVARVFPKNKQQFQDVVNVIQSRRGRNVKTF